MSASIKLNVNQPQMTQANTYDVVELRSLNDVINLRLPPNEESAEKRKEFADFAGKVKNLTDRIKAIPSEKYSNAVEKSWVDYDASLKKYQKEKNMIRVAAIVITTLFALSLAAAIVFFPAMAAAGAGGGMIAAGVGSLVAAPLFFFYGVAAHILAWTNVIAPKKPIIGREILPNAIKKGNEAVKGMTSELNEDMKRLFSEVDEQITLRIKNRDKDYQSYVDTAVKNREPITQNPTEHYNRIVSDNDTLEAAKKFWTSTGCDQE